MTWELSQTSARNHNSDQWCHSLCMWDSGLVVVRAQPASRAGHAGLQQASARVVHGHLPPEARDAAAGSGQTPCEPSNLVPSNTDRALLSQALLVALDPTHQRSEWAVLPKEEEKAAPRNTQQTSSGVHTEGPV